MALLFTLMQNEANVRSHQAKVLVLTDCIELGYIFRLKDSSSKLLEVSLYISTFDNVYVRYSIGSSLFMADLLSRQWNKIFVNEDQEKISDLFAQLQPPLSKKNFGATLNPQMLTDLLSSSPQAEYLDCFTKRRYYDQSLSRYHANPKNILTLENEPQPVELSFLAELQ